MTPTQYRTVLTLLHQLDAKVERVEERLQFVFPTEREAAEQIHREVDAILGPGVRVFAD